MTSTHTVARKTNKIQNQPNFYQRLVVKQYSAFGRGAEVKDPRDSGSRIHSLPFQGVPIGTQHGTDYWD